MIRTLRMWVKFVHTGEALGLIRQTIAALSAFGAAVLVWTGFMLAWRRFRARARTELFSSGAAIVRTPD